MVFEINGIEFFDSIRRVKMAYANNPTLEDGQDRSEDIAYDLLVDSNMSREDFDEFLDTLTDEDYVKLNFFSLRVMRSLNDLITDYTKEQ